MLYFSLGHDNLTAKMMSMYVIETNHSKNILEMQGYYIPIYNQYKHLSSSIYPHC